MSTTAFQNDLFGAAILPGLSQRDEMITPEEEAELIRRIDGIELMPFSYRGFEGKRLTASFGWKYDFNTAKFQSAESIPDFLLSLRARAAAFAGLPEDELVQALLIRYDPGAGIGWHRDRPVFQHVVGVSLGSEAVMRFRKRAGTRFLRAEAPLRPRAAYHLSGEARWEWEHSIAERAVTRWSITFRSLSAQNEAPRSHD
ncbi:MAG TPA: alpha-ketoglutarate-dependent dioxygenase AlkB [Stellaceae bacterium]|jgi:alkylated DNA repair dioxygenase AlkB|nr:alpha-ketoglutarate-dependent dioxygenase AlkB [Stellaceae bacterium]